MEKIRFIRSMLAAGLSPLFSDLDVVWLRDPLPYVRQFEEPNVLVSSDAWEVAANASTGKLDDCHTVVGSERTVVAHSGFVGRMNVSRPFRQAIPSALPRMDEPDSLEEALACSGVSQKGVQNDKPFQDPALQVGVHFLRPSAIAFTEVSHSAPRMGYD